MEACDLTVNPISDDKYGSDRDESAGYRLGAQPFS
jgi:hypothetical protein